jgi:molybdenum cofactor synthesis domain-containing protein
MIRGEIMRVGIICMSDKGSKGEREDLSTKVIIECVEEFGYEVRTTTLIPDEEDLIERKLLEVTERGDVDLILTTGGTGFSPRDVTPEATLKVIERLTPGIPAVKEILGYILEPVHHGLEILLKKTGDCARK